MLRAFLFVKGAVRASADVCLMCVCEAHVGGREEKEGIDAWFTTVRPLWHKQKNKTSTLFLWGSPLMLHKNSFVTEGLCLLSIMCFVAGLK